MLDRHHPNELSAPPAAQADPEARELLRAWIVKGGLQVSLVKGFDDPAVWGLLLVDIARHAARIYAAEGQSSEAAAMVRIQSMWKAEMENVTDAGTTGPLQ